MPSIPVNQVRKGNSILWNGIPHVVLATEHVKPGKGPAYVQAKLKNLKQGNILTNRFNSSDKVETLFTSRQKHSYSYDAGDAFVFMNSESFEEHHVPRDMLEDRILLLKAGDEVDLEFVGDDLVDITFPKVVVHEITDTPPAIKGATATNQLKPATTETGLEIKVPPFMAVGDRVRIDTDTMSYMERAKD